MLGCGLRADSGKVYRPEELTGAYIYLIAKHVHWPPRKGAGAFRIGVVEKDAKITSVLKRYTKNLTLHDRPIQVIDYRRLKDVDFRTLDLLYIDTPYRDKVKSFYARIPKNQPLLLITNSVVDSDDIMIDIYFDRLQHSHIQINLNNLEEHGLSVDRQILLAGSNAIGVSRLFKSSLEQLKKQELHTQELEKKNRILTDKLRELKKKVAGKEAQLRQHTRELLKKKKELNRKKESLQRIKKKLEEQKKQLEKQQATIAEKVKKLEVLTQTALELKKELMAQKERLARQKKEVTYENEVLKLKLAQVRMMEKVQNEKEETLKKLDRRIQRQKRVIDRQKKMIEEQQASLQQRNQFIYLLFLLTMVLLGFIAYWIINTRRVKELNHKLLEAKTEADQANRFKSIFLANMSHELRTPLNTILGFSQLLKEDDRIDGDMRKQLSMINRSGHFLLSLIDGVLDLARIEAGKIDIVHKPFEPRKMIAEVIDMMHSRSEKKALTIESDIAENVPTCLIGDLKKTEEIVMNFLSNAIKYSNEGEILVTMRWQKDKLEIAVIDEGPGIAEEDLENIFKPFVRVGDTLKQKGTGLGLAIAREYAEAMGGSVGVDSEVGKGSRFYVVLPMEVCEIESFENMDENCIGVIGIEPSGKPVKVMVVDDRPENNQLLRALLEKWGFEVVEASNGFEAVEKFKLEPVDFIWLDMQMPGIDGNETARRIRKLPFGKDVPIVILTANAFEEGLNEIDHGIVQDVVIKPFKINTIHEKMKAFLDVPWRYEASTDHDGEPDNGLEKFDIDGLSKVLSRIDKERLKALYNATILLNRDAVEEILEQWPERDVVMVVKQNLDKMDFSIILDALDKNLQDT